VDLLKQAGESLAGRKVIGLPEMARILANPRALKS